MTLTWFSLNPAGHIVTTGGVCNQTGLDAAKSGKSLATVSDVGFGLGIAALATSAVMLLTGSSDQATEHTRAPRFQPLFAGGRSGFITGWSHAF